MSKVTINDFLVKLGFDGKEVTKGFEQVEKRALKLNNKLAKSQKALARVYKDSVEDANKKEQSMQRMLNLKKREQSLANKKNKMSASEIGLQTKLARLEKLTLDVENKRLKNLQQRRNLLANAKVKKEQIKRATIATASAEERSANASKRYANSSARVSRNTAKTARNARATSVSLKSSVDSANKLQNFLLRGALAYGAFTIGRGIASNTLSAGMDSSRAQVGLEAVSQHIGSSIGVSDPKLFAENQMDYAKHLALTLNRDVVGSQESWRDMLGASISTIERHGAEGFNNVKDVFTGITEASAIFKLNKAQTGLMMLGAKQSLQKGKLQAEEVVRQIAERSPLAIGELVKAIRTVKGDMSLTEADMYKMMENGELLAYEIMPEWGRNLSKMAKQLAGGDMEFFMQKSAAGAWDGVLSGIQNIQIGFFEQIDAPLARLLTTFKDLLLNLEFIWKPAGVWLGNVFDLANEDLKKFVENAKEGKGIFESIFGHTGGQEGWTERRANITDKKQLENSKNLFDKSKAFYEGMRSFLVGENPEEQKGGFLGGIIDFLSVAKTAVLALLEPMKELAKMMGIDAPDSAKTSETLGWLTGVWITSNLTGATNMFVAMTEAFGSMGKALGGANFGAFTKFLTSPQALTLVASLAALTGVAVSEDGVMGTIKKASDIIGDEDKNILQKGVGLAQLGTIPMKDKVMSGDWIKPTYNAVAPSSMRIKEGDWQGLVNFVSGQGSIGNIFKHKSQIQQDNVLKKLYGTSDYSDDFNFGNLHFALSKGKGYSGMNSSDAFTRSSMSAGSYGNLTQGLTPDNAKEVLSGHLIIELSKDGVISKSDVVQLSNLADGLRINQTTMSYDTGYE